MPLRSRSVRATFILQNKMRRLRGRERLKPLSQKHANASLIIDRERFAAPRAEPEVFHAMTVRGGRFLPGKLLEAEKTSLPVIKIGVAFGMGALQIHQLRMAASPMGLDTHLRWKIRSCLRVVKLNKFILGIEARGFSSAGFIVRGSNPACCHSDPALRERNPFIL